MFLLIALVILSLFVPIDFFCYVSAWPLAAGSKIMEIYTVFTEFVMMVKLFSMFLLMLFDGFTFFIILHY